MFSQYSPLLFLIVRDKDYWWVGRDVGKPDGAFRAKVDELDQQLLPLEGWQYKNDRHHIDGEWHFDQSMEWSREVTSAINEWTARKEEKTRYNEEIEKLESEVEEAARLGDVSRLKQLQQLEIGGIFTSLTSSDSSYPIACS